MMNHSGRDWKYCHMLLCPDSLRRGCPKYRQARIEPTTFPPKGACEMYMDMDFLFEARNASRVARIIL
jgi:hypothetical protein